MRGAPGKLGRGLCTAMACLVALLATSCSLRRALGPDSYVSPDGRAAVPPAEGDIPKAAPAATPDSTAPAAPAGQSPPAPGGPADGPLAVTVRQAIVMALENNPELAVERLEPRILGTYIEEEWSVFDPLLTGMFGYERIRSQDLSSGGTWFNYNTDSAVGEAALAKRFPTGTSVELGALTEVDDASADGQQLVASRLGLTLSQALLRGAGTAVNLARVREARLDVLASEYEVRGFTEALIALVEQTYWDYALARRQIEIYDQSIALAEKLREDVLAWTAAGILSASDVAAADAEVALRRQDRVDACSDRDKAEVLLHGFLDPPESDRKGRDMRFVDGLAMPGDRADDVESHLRVAQRQRPDLNQTRLQVQRGDLQIVRTRNGLLPRLDLFVTFGKSGYSQVFGGSWKKVDGDRHDILVGLTLEQPLGNHEAQAQHKRAVLSRRQREEAVRNIEQLAETDVKTAYIEANRAREKMAAVATTRRLDDEKLRIENERFRQGQASSFQVARAQRDLVRRQIAEAEAMAEYNKALVELYRLDGSLLVRRGIEAPGTAPADPTTTGP